ncbi:MAG: cell division protein FtsZ, partial [Oscillospiraceae bacterium]|nr:cell division protein FtsZ [Oscillospiraceae bacterium]
DQKITFANAFSIADDVLKQAVTSISELVGFSKNVIINLDFADVSSVMKDAGRAHMGVGNATGREKAEAAAAAAISSPLLETAINGATGVLINITGSAEMTLDEVETAAGIVQEAANPEANIIFGATIDETFGDELRVTVIATGFDQSMGGSVVFAKKEEAKPVVEMVAEAEEAAPVKKPVIEENVDDIDAVLSIFKR